MQQCDDVCVMRVYVCMYACDYVLSGSVLIVRECLQGTCRVLLPKIILFLLALLTPLVLIFLKENKNEVLICIYRFAVCV